MSSEPARKLLTEGVQELYYTEQQLLDALDTLSEQTEHEDAERAFSEHREETQEQVDRLEEVFELIDAEEETKRERVVDAMIEEHEEFAGENEGPTLDRYNIALEQKIEHYEIAAYSNVTSLAGKLGHDEAADLLEENLQEEEQALEELSETGEQFDRQEIAEG